MYQNCGLHSLDALPIEVLRNEDGGDEFGLETVYGQHRQHLKSNSM